LKKRKRSYITLLADEKITQEEYREMIDANNTKLNELLQRRDKLVSVIEQEKNLTEDLNQLKSELISFLNFDELTPQMLHRLVTRIEVREDGMPRIHYRFSAPNN
jgi:nucleoid-associated protein YejK